METKKDEAATTKPADAAKKTSILDELDMPKETVFTAWYTPEIPVSEGPENYWGSAGLILEVNDGKTVILCSKVILNPKVTSEIKASIKGKVTSQKEFDETVLKKLEEFKQMNQGRGGNGTTRMRIGG